MSECTHRTIISYATEDDQQPVNLWACADCSNRFVPIDHITALESALLDCVTHMKTAGSPEAVRACEAAERLLGVKR